MRTKKNKKIVVLIMLRKSRFRYTSLLESLENVATWITVFRDPFFKHVFLLSGFIWTKQKANCNSSFDPIQRLISLCISLEIMCFNNFLKAKQIHELLIV